MRSVRQLGTELCTGHGMVQRVAAKLGSGIESVRSWVGQTDSDDGHTPSVSTAEAKRIAELEQENRKLKGRRS